MELERHGASQSAARLKIVYAMLCATILIGAFRFVTGSDHGTGVKYHDPALYRYLESSLELIKRF